MKPAGIGENRPRPTHEGVQTAELANERIAWAEMQMVRIRQDHLRAHRLELHRVERFDRRQGADGHECGRRHVTVRRGEGAGAGSFLASGDDELKAHSNAIASP